MPRYASSNPGNLGSPEHFSQQLIICQVSQTRQHTPLATTSAPPTLGLHLSNSDPLPAVTSAQPAAASTPEITSSLLQFVHIPCPLVPTCKLIAQVVQPPCQIRVVFRSALHYLPCLLNGLLQVALAREMDRHLYLEAGHAHDVCQDDEYAVYPFWSSNDVVLLFTMESDSLVGLIMLRLGNLGRVPDGKQVDRGHSTLHDSLPAIVSLNESKMECSTSVHK